jgi:hypothetical protein
LEYLLPLFSSPDVPVAALVGRRKQGEQEVRKKERNRSGGQFGVVRVSVIRDLEQEEPFQWLQFAPYHWASLHVLEFPTMPLIGLLHAQR